MNSIILTIGLLFVALGATSAETVQQINERINAISDEAEALSSISDSVRNTDLPNLPQQILQITESNKLIIQTKNHLKKYEEKGDAAKDCQVLFNVNYYSILDQLYVQANDMISAYVITGVDILLKFVNERLNTLSKQVENWDKTSAEDKNKITKEINEIYKVVKDTKTSTSTYVQNILTIIEIEMFPKEAERNIFKPVDECLKKIGSDE